MKRTILLLVGLCILFSLISFAPTLAQDDAEADLIPLRVVIPPFLEFVPFYIAVEEGYFEEQGLDVELLEFRRSSEAFAPFVQGEIQILAGSVNASWFNTMARSDDFRWVATLGTEREEDICSPRVLMVNTALIEAGAYEEPADIAGKTVRYRSQTMQAFLTTQILAAFDLTEDDVTQVDLSSTEAFDGLEGGTIDFTFSGEPSRTRYIEGNIAVDVISLRDTYPNYHTSGILFGPSMFGRDDMAGEKFLAAYLKAAHQHNEGPTEANIAIIEAALGMEPAELEAMCWTSVSDDGELYPAFGADFQEWALEKALIDEVLELDEYWDASFLEGAQTMIMDETDTDASE